MTTLIAEDEFVIRNVNPADLDQLVAWINGDPNLDFLTGEILREALENYFHEREQEICCIAEYGGRAVGYIEFYPSRLWTDVYGDSSDERPWGIDVFVGSPADRNQGLGCQMLKVVAYIYFRSGRRRGLSSIPRHRMNVPFGAMRKLDLKIKIHSCQRDGKRRV
ncbi:MAG: GNAT family N-acetyltransferase [Caldilineaceae bacterium]